MRTTSSILLAFGISTALACNEEAAVEGGDTTDPNSSTGLGATSTAQSGSSTAALDDTSAATSDLDGSTGMLDDCSGRGLRPSARSEFDGVWDSGRQAMIMFGGDQGIPVMCSPQSDFVAETWALHPDCDEFELLDEGGMIIHGGRWRPGTMGAYTLYDDTWAFDLATDTWEPIASAGPVARTNHTAVVANNQLLIYGGNASTDGLAFIPLDDLWSLDLDTGVWTELQTLGAPSPRLFHAATISADQGTMFIYGGGDESAFTGPFFPELLALDLRTGQWSLLHDGSGTAPVGSIWGELLLDPTANRLLSWGAHEDNQLGNNNKIWEFDLGSNSWTMLEEGDVLDNVSATFCNFPADFVIPAEGTPERRSAGVGVLTDDNELLIFGGKTDCGFVDDVWSWPLAGGPWNNRVRATQGEICVRAFAEGCDSMCM